MDRSAIHSPEKQEYIQHGDTHGHSPSLMYFTLTDKLMCLSTSGGSN